VPYTYSTSLRPPKSVDELTSPCAQGNPTPPAPAGPAHAPSSPPSRQSSLAAAFQQVWLRQAARWNSAADACPAVTTTAPLACPGQFLIADSPCPPGSSPFAPPVGKLGTRAVQRHQRTLLVLHIRLCHVGKLASPCHRRSGRRHDRVLKGSPPDRVDEDRRPIGPMAAAPRLAALLNPRGVNGTATHRRLGATRCATHPADASLASSVALVSLKRYARMVRRLIVCRAHSGDCHVQNTS
jgi:hypothetical protein